MPYCNRDPKRDYNLDKHPFACQHMGNILPDKGNIGVSISYSSGVLKQMGRFTRIGDHPIRSQIVEFV